MFFFGYFLLIIQLFQRVFLFSLDFLGSFLVFFDGIE